MTEFNEMTTGNSSSPVRRSVPPSRVQASHPGTTRGYALAPGQGLTQYPDDPWIKASAASTGGFLTLIESRLQHGPPRHVHEHEDESFYVLEGSLTAFCGDDAWEARPGSFVFLPRGIPHHFTIDSESATVLLIATPGGIEEYFRKISAASDETARQRVRSQYGIHRAGSRD